MVATFKPVNVSGQRCVVVAQQPAEVAYSPIGRVGRQLLAGTGILALAALATQLATSGHLWSLLYLQCSAALVGIIVCYCKSG